MDLCKEILIGVLERGKVCVDFPNLKIDTTELVELECYKALQKIKAILEDDDLEDEECFLKIEEIVCVFESIGSNGGNRHDFV